MTTASTAYSFSHRLGHLLASYMAGADVLGRVHVVQHYQRRLRRPIPRLNTMAAIAKFADDHPNLFLIKSDIHALPTDAINHLRGLTPVTRQLFDGLEARYQAQAFTVSFLTDTRLIGQVQDKVGEALITGSNLGTFDRAIYDLTSDAGVEALTDWHVETVFRTNVQTAYSSGRLEQMRDPDVTEFFPYWRYSAVMDDRTRPSHALMNGFTARADDGVWNLWWPPAGYNCRCTTIPVAPDDLPEGMSADAADSPGVARLHAMPDEGFGGLGGIV